MSKLIIIANWKANPQTLKEALFLAKKVESGIAGFRDIEVAIAPPFVFVGPVGSALKRAKLGAQNCFFDKGPYTGEISPEQLKSFGVKYVIVGHSERRIYLGETDEAINKKVKALLEHNIVPILCIGERERTAGEIPEIIAEELRNALKGVKASLAKNLIIAYEPVWAISTMPGARADTPDNAFRVMLYMRRVLTELFGSKTANAVRIIYGGSVKSSNAVSFLQEGGMAGALVGGASLNAEEFIKVVSLSRKVLRMRKRREI